MADSVLAYKNYAFEKQSRVIRGRNPFKKDINIDYDLDSEEEMQQLKEELEGDSVDKESEDEDNE